MKFSVLIVQILIWSAQVSALGASELLLSDRDSFEAVDNIPLHQVMADLEVIRYAVKNAYAGSDFTEKLQKFPLRAMSSQEFCRNLDDITKNVRDGHLIPQLEFSRCGVRRPLSQIGQNRAPGSSWYLETISTPQGQAQLLALPKLLAEGDSAWVGFLDSVKAIKSADQPFILDLRGNDGWDDGMGFEMARILLGLPDDVNVPTPVKSRRFRWTPESFAIQANQIEAFIRYRQLHNEVVEDSLRDRKAQLLEWYQKAIERRFPKEYIQESSYGQIDRSKVFSNAVIVLVDNACASACENTLALLEPLPKRVLIGDSTAGAVEFGEVGLVWLPNSHVTLKLSTMNVKFRDGRRVDRVGYRPDVRVSSGRDALNTALRYLGLL